MVWNNAKGLYTQTHTQFYIMYIIFYCFVFCLEYGGNSDGKQCAFPFTYKNQTYYTCTNEDAEIGRFWCATTGSYDKEEQWSYLEDYGPCVFPFIYKGQSFSACTKAGSSDGKLWCSLSSNYDREPKWTYCTPSELRPCKFPFQFSNKYYFRCTSDGASDDQLWCATTANYDTDKKWRACATEGKRNNSNSKGKRCVFPFIYNGTKFNSCTNQNSEDGRFWCSVTHNYDKSQQWSYCADTSKINQKLLYESEIRISGCNIWVQIFS
uniref:Fibronectin type-II domain-containing protein n=1 Tax=Naja naja TaxID=35670 RepID=A0A8C6YCL6_NAJNA